MRWTDEHGDRRVERTPQRDGTAAGFCNRPGMVVAAGRRYATDSSCGRARMMTDRRTRHRVRMRIAGGYATIQHERKNHKRDGERNGRRTSCGPMHTIRL